MDGDSIGKELGRLATAVEDLEQRVRRLENRAGRDTFGAVEASVATSEPTRPADLRVANGLTLAGRSLVILAGAYLLRAFSDGAVLALPLGVLLGFGYATVWIWMADRAARFGRRASAFFHGTSAALIAYPLIWETGTRFALLSPVAGITVLVAATAALLGVAYRGELQGLAWIAAAGGTFVAFPLAIGGMGWLAPACGYLVLLAVAILGIDPIRSWPGLRWTTAGVADLAVLVLGTRAFLPRSDLSFAEVVSVQLAFFVLFAGSLTAFALGRWRRIDTFAVFQTAAALLLGYGGALRMFVAFDAPHLPAVGIASLAVSALAYVVSFAVVHRGSRRRFLYLSSLAFVFLVAGSGLALPGPAYVWSFAAVALTAAGGSASRPTLGLHGALAALAAALSSGLLGHSLSNLAGPTAGHWRDLPPAALAALGAAALCLALPRVSGTGGWQDRLPTLGHLVVFAWGGGGLAVALLAPAVVAVPSDPGALSVLRTFVVAAATVALAWARRSLRYREAAWLVYPLLGSGLVKLLLEDLPNGRPGTLFLSLALYGGALIAVARFRPSTAPVTSR